MADKPILFSAPMITALLAGKKTQTRRIVKPQPSGDVLHCGWAGKGAIWTDKHGGLGLLKYWVGHRLWVREAWRTHTAFDHLSPRDLPFGAVAYFDADERHDFTGRLRASMHMPRCCSRLTLIVDGVKVERLQEISRGDAMLEGCPFPNMAAGPNPRDWYRDLWSGINPKAPWEANPWVAAYTFRVIRANIDQVPA